MKNEIMELLEQNLGFIDFTSDCLVDDGILDSLSLVTIISLLSMQYGITISYEEIIPENFNSVDAMAKLVERCQEVQK